MVVLNLSKATNWDRTLDWHVEQRDSVTLVGYRFSDGWARNQKLYFCSRFSQPIRSLEQDSVKNMIWMLFSIFPAIIAGLMILLVVKYPINK